MAEKHIVVQGAMCKCQFGQAPDKIKVLSHKKEYANDKDASKKLIVTTKEIGEQHWRKTLSEIVRKWAIPHLLANR